MPVISLWPESPRTPGETLGAAPCSPCAKERWDAAAHAQTTRLRQMAGPAFWCFGLRCFRPVHASQPQMGAGNGTVTKELSRSVNVDRTAANLSVTRGLMRNGSTTSGALSCATTPPWLWHSCPRARRGNASCRLRSGFLSTQTCPTGAHCTAPRFTRRRVVAAPSVCADCAGSCGSRRAAARSPGWSFPPRHRAECGRLRRSPPARGGWSWCRCGPAARRPASSPRVNRRRLVGPDPALPPGFGTPGQVAERSPQARPAAGGAAGDPAPGGDPADAVLARRPPTPRSPRGGRARGGARRSTRHRQALAPTVRRQGNSGRAPIEPFDAS